MIKKTILSSFLICFFIAALAQERPARNSNHYVGVQINQLIRQILNFGGASQTLNNPYLINYAVNSLRTNIGLNVGVGFTHNESMDGDPITRTTSKVNEFFLRSGIEKKSSISQKWMLVTGFDLLLELSNNRIIIDDNLTGNFREIDKITGWGGGPRVAMHYKFNEKMMVGTELSYYFKSIQNENTNSSHFTYTYKMTKFQFSSPAVIFFTLKL